MGAQITNAAPADLGSGQVPRAARLLTVLFVGRVVIDGLDTICRVRNISDGGLMIETCHPLQPGQRVHLDLRGSVAADGEVRWARDGKAGIRTDAPLPIPVLLDPNGAQPGQIARAPRFTANCLCDLRTGAAVHPARMVDISQKGARVIAGTSLDLQTEIILSVPGIPPKAGKVRWVRGGATGIALYEPLSFDQLSRWLENQSGRFEAGLPALEHA